MFDGVWSKVLDRVILEPISAFGFTILAEEPVIFTNYTRLRMNSSCVLGDSEEGIIVLPSHVLAFLNIIHEDDLSSLQLTTEKPCRPFEDQNRQRRLFEHATWIGESFQRPDSFGSPETANALQIACESQNRAAVDMILRATRSLFSDSAFTILFRTRTPYHDYPIHMTIQSRGSKLSDKLSNFHIVETLLKLERCDFSMCDFSSHPQLAAEPYVSQQWSLRSMDLNSGEPALHRAVEYFEEDQMSHLLSIARPTDINVRDDMGFTVLHLIVRRGSLGLTRELVELYNADIEAESTEGLTPPYLALKKGKDELVEYFKSRGANFDSKAVKED